MEIDMPVNTDDVNNKWLKIVYFDLETTGLDTNAEIVQLAAKCGKYEFNAYVNPSKEISRSASKVTELTNFAGMLCHISLTFSKKWAKHNITYKQIFDLYQNKGSEGIHAMFTERNNNKIKITKDQKFLSRLVEFSKTEKANDF